MTKLRRMMIEKKTSSPYCTTAYQKDGVQNKGKKKWKIL